MIHTGNATSGENKKYKSRPPDTANLASHLLTLTLLASRVVPIGLIYARKHIVPACGVLALLPACIVGYTAISIQ